MSNKRAKSDKNYREKVTMVAISKTLSDQLSAIAAYSESSRKQVIENMLDSFIIALGEQFERNYVLWKIGDYQVFYQQKPLQ